MVEEALQEGSYAMVKKHSPTTRHMRWHETSANVLDVALYFVRV